MHRADASTRRRPRRSFEERRESDAARRERRAAVDDPAVLMEAAAAFLATRARSVGETRRRLRSHGYPPALIEEVLTRLVEMRYLDDEAFARAWVESRDRSRPRGETALRRELALKGVDREVVARVLAERAVPAEEGTGPPDVPDRSAAERLLAKHRRALEREVDPRKRRQRAYALLARSGFDPEICAELSRVA